MAYVITRMCRDCKDMGCVAVCPVTCIYDLRETPDPQHPPQLYIHPVECINCGACEPECPWDAIYEEPELPAVFAADIEVNALTQREPGAFVVATMPRDEHGRLAIRPAPSAAQVVANKRRWGLAE